MRKADRLRAAGPPSGRPIGRCLGRSGGQFVARQVGELLDEVDGLLRVIGIDHLDGKAGVHEQEIADARLRREVDGHAARDAEDVHRGHAVAVKLRNLRGNS